MTPKPGYETLSNAEKHIQQTVRATTPIDRFESFVGKAIGPTYKSAIR
jgi:hypothetical protein